MCNIIIYVYLQCYIFYIYIYVYIDIYRYIYILDWTSKKRKATSCYSKEHTQVLNLEYLGTHCALLVKP